MRRSRIAALLGVPALVAAFSGVVGTGPASASVEQLLCVDGTTTCAYAHGSNPVEMITDEPDSTNYLLNEPPHGPGQIQQAGTGMCLQLDHAAGNTVIEAACNGASYQHWTTEGSGMLVIGQSFVSQWDPNLCLTYNESKSILDAVNCNAAWYQLFLGYPEV